MNTEMMMNFDEMDKKVTLDFNGLDTATRGKVSLILANVSERATKNGTMRLYFEFANANGQTVCIGVWKDHTNEFFVKLRFALQRTEQGNALVQVLADNYHTYHISTDANGYPFIDFMKMKGDQA